MRGYGVLRDREHRMREAPSVCVVGGGPAGYTCAFRAADLGLRVTLIEQHETLGGVCLNRGCIPSKALLRIARVIRETQELESAGLTFEHPRIDLERLRSFKVEIVRKLTSGLADLAGRRGVEVIRGRARLAGGLQVEIDSDGNTRAKGFDRIVLATGSGASIPDVLRLDDERVWDSTRALDLPQIPRRLLVVGGGYVGLELASIYAALGSEVTVVEMMPRVLAGADGELVRILQRRLIREAVGIRTGCRVVDVELRSAGIDVTLKDATKTERVQCDALLVTVGRVPDSGSLALERAGVDVDRRGFVLVDEFNRTSVAGILAIGDVAGKPMLAHKGYYEGRRVAEMLAGKEVRYERAPVPSVVFTDPEIAWCGLDEEAARREGLEVLTARFRWGASGRAIAEGRPEGMTKLVIERGAGRVLGVAIVGSQAGELIGEALVALQAGVTVDDWGEVIHPHPTFSETLQDAIAEVLGRPVHTVRR